MNKNIWIVILVVLVIVFIAGFLFMQNNNDKNTQINESQESVTVEKDINDSADEKKTMKIETDENTNEMDDNIEFGDEEIDEELEKIDDVMKELEKNEIDENDLNELNM